MEHLRVVVALWRKVVCWSERTAHSGRQEGGMEDSLDQVGHRYHPRPRLLQVASDFPVQPLCVHFPIGQKHPKRGGQKPSPDLVLTFSQFVFCRFCHFVVEKLPSRPDWRIGHANTVVSQFLGFFTVFRMAFKIEWDRGWLTQTVLIGPIESLSQGLPKQNRNVTKFLFWRSS